MVPRRSELRLPDAVCFFEVSPDEKHLSMADSRRAGVALFKLDCDSGTETRRILSADWPEQVGRGFLLPKEH